MLCGGGEVPIDTRLGTSLRGVNDFKGVSTNSLAKIASISRSGDGPHPVDTLMVAPASSSLLISSESFSASDKLTSGSAEISSAKLSSSVRGKGSKHERNSRLNGFQKKIFQGFIKTCFLFQKVSQQTWVNAFLSFYTVLGKFSAVFVGVGVKTMANTTNTV